MDDTHKAKIAEALLQTIEVATDSGTIFYNDYQNEVQFVYDEDGALLVLDDTGEGEQRRYKVRVVLDEV